MRFVKDRVTSPKLPKPEEGKGREGKAAGRARENANKCSKLELIAFECHKCVRQGETDRERSSIGNDC